MNEFDAWHQILSQWKDVTRVKSLNQQLYDQLVGAIIFILKYAEKNAIALPNRDSLNRLLDNAEKIIDDINHLTFENQTSDDRIQPPKNHSSDEEEYRAEKSMI
jgi:hypothetical protein